MFERLGVRIVLFAALISTVPVAIATTDPSDRNEKAEAPQLIQPGERLVLLGVTSDNHALVQEGSTVFATELKRGARKQFVATTPPGNVAYVYTVGEVAFVWTNPDRSVNGFGVSPLIVWSDASGANKASDNSPIGTFTTSASDNGRYVMYTTRGPADGSVGDIEFARTDMSERRTLVAQVPMSFPVGACRPWGSFVGQGQRSRPVTLACENGATSPTLAAWNNRGEQRVTLVESALSPPYFTASPDGTQLFTALSGSRTPVVVNMRGELRRLEEGFLSRRGFFTSRNDVFYSAFVDLTKAGEIRRASLRTGATSSVVNNFLLFITPQQGSDLIVTPPSSPDGSKLAYQTGFDPNTGLNDLWIANLNDGGGTAIEATNNTYLPGGFVTSGPLFSTDSAYTLYGRVDDLATGSSSLVAAGPKGKVSFGAPSFFTHDRLVGANIAFSDNFRFDPNNIFNSTADLKLVDLSQPDRTLRTVAPQAYSIFFPANRGRELTFTTAKGAQGAGLYTVRARASRDDD
ncbi:MAG: hypothetical protein ABL931_14010 [Usitatibacteraceae bacterium]